MFVQLKSDDRRSVLPSDAIDRCVNDSVGSEVKWGSSVELLYFQSTDTPQRYL